MNRRLALPAAILLLTLPVAASIPSRQQVVISVPVPDAPPAPKALPEFSVSVKPAPQGAVCDDPTDCAFVPEDLRDHRPVLVVYLSNKMIVVVRCAVKADGSGRTDFKFYDTDSWSEDLVDPDSAWRSKIEERLVWVRHCDHLYELRWKENLLDGYQLPPL
jgi:hypothetical protein